jgi:hypothetical protein
LLHGAHVHRVDVRPLFAIDLDRDIMAVQEARDFFVLEGLALHDVAPVTGRIADRQEYRATEPRRFGKGLVAPGKPVHRIVRMLQQVGAALQQQPVAEARPALLVAVMRARYMARATSGNRFAERVRQFGRKRGAPRGGAVSHCLSPGDG